MLKCVALKNVQNLNEILENKLISFEFAESFLKKIDGKFKSYLFPVGLLLGGRRTFLYFTSPGVKKLYVRNV